MNQDDVDVVVLGGGPAGCATALALGRKNISTMVIERSKYDAPRIGETLPPMARPLLLSLGVWDRFVSQGHLPAFGARSIWGRDDLYENDYIFNPHGHGWHLDRAAFDAMLAAAAEEAGTKIYRGAQLLSVNSISSKGWELEIHSGEATHRCRTKFFVDASGRAASFARKQGSRRVVYDHLIGVVAFLSNGTSEQRPDSFIMVEAIEQGWWYSALLPNHDLVMAYMTDADLYANSSKEMASSRWEGWLESAPHTLSRAKSFDLKTAPTILPAGTSRLDIIAGKDWLAVGDAVISFDPLSSQGICQALKSGLYAAEVIESYLAGEISALADYALAVITGFNVYLQSRSTFYMREKRWPRSIFWQRRQPSLVS